MLYSRILLIAVLSVSALLAAKSYADQPVRDQEQFEAKLQWELETPNALPQAACTDAQGEHLFVALKTGGVAILRLRGDRVPKLVAKIPRHQLGGLEAMNLFRRQHLLFIALGNFFAKGRPAGLAIIDVSNPSRAKVTSVWKSDEPMRGSAVVVVDRTTAYLGGMSHGVLTFDVRDPNAIKHLATYQPDIHFPQKNPNSIQHPNARGMAIHGNLLYVAYDAGGLRVLNVRNPKQPREIARYINPKMKGKAQAYNNIVLDGTKAYIAIDYAGLEVVDIAKPTKIRQLGWWNPWQAGTVKNVWVNSPGHTNQILFDKQRKQVYLSAGDSELRVINVANSQAPVGLGGYGEPKNKLGVWGLAARKKQVYLCYIKTAIPFRGTWSGIKAVQLEE